MTLISEGATVPKHWLAVGSVAMSAWITDCSAHVVQQLLGAGLGEFGDAVAVGPGEGPVEVRQTRDSTVPAQQLEERVVVDSGRCCAELFDGLGVGHVGDCSDLVRHRTPLEVPSARLPVSGSRDCLLSLDIGDINRRHAAVGAYAGRLVCRVERQAAPAP